MKYHSASIVLVFCSATSLGADFAAAARGPESSPGPRESSEITAGWQFQIDARDLGERERWYTAGFDRSGWSAVAVPRAWDCFDEALRGYEGVGWYCVTLDGSWRRSGKVQHVTFGRVMYHAKVWLNGELLGENVGGYLPFAFDITGKLNGSANHLVLRVDNRPRIDWLPAATQIEWVQYGGILQPVRVETKGRIFLSDLALCDRLGILFLEELPINWWGVEWFGKEGVVQDEKILDRALLMLETMVRRDRNHPSIIIWSMANESKTDNAIGIKVMRTLIRRTKELDPTRLVTFVTAPGSVRDHRAYEDAHFVATNMYYGSLIEPLAERRDQLDLRVRRPTAEHLRHELAAFPNKPLLITEFGAKGLHGLHGDVVETEDFQADIVRATWAAVAGVPDVSGGVLWSWADYNHRRHFQANGAFGTFGAVTIDRKPKATLEALATMYGGDTPKRD